MREPRPLSPTPTAEVPLPQAPLARVIAQARFPTILAIHDRGKVANFQEALRERYPRLSEDHVHRIELKANQAPNVDQSLIWRLVDREQNPRWRVSLGVNFVAIETSDYHSRQDFLDRLRVVLAAVETAFKPAEATRLGMRYIDRLTGNAVDRVSDLVQPEILGITHPAQNLDSALGASIIHLMTEAQFLAGDSSRIQGRWGKLPPNTTYDSDALEPVAEPSWVLDLDMFTSVPQPFASEGLLQKTTEFAECLYWLFRQMVTDEFLRFFGGES